MLELLPYQHKTAGIPDQELDAVATLAAIDDDRAGERVFTQHLLRQCGKSMCAFAVMWSST